jgi:hypothetical protein
MHSETRYFYDRNLLCKMVPEINLVLALLQTHTARLQYSGQVTCIHATLYATKATYEGHLSTHSSICYP